MFSPWLSSTETGPNITTPINPLSKTHSASRQSQCLHHKSGALKLRHSASEPGRDSGQNLRVWGASFERNGFQHSRYNLAICSRFGYSVHEKSGWFSYVTLWHGIWRKYSPMMCSYIQDCKDEILRYPTLRASLIPKESNQAVRQFSKSVDGWANHWKRIGPEGSLPPEGKTNDDSIPRKRGRWRWCKDLSQIWTSLRDATGHKYSWDENQSWCCKRKATAHFGRLPT